MSELLVVYDIYAYIHRECHFISIQRFYGIYVPYLNRVKNQSFYFILNMKHSRVVNYKDILIKKLFKKCFYELIITDYTRINFVLSRNFFEINFQNFSV